MDKPITNVSFRVDEEFYKKIKKFAKEQRKMNVKGYFLFLAQEDMKQPDLETTNDDTQIAKIQKYEKLLEVQRQEIEKYKKILTTIEFAMENYKK